MNFNLGLAFSDPPINAEFTSNQPITGQVFSFTEVNFGGHDVTILAVISSWLTFDCHIAFRCRQEQITASELKQNALVL